MGASPTIFFVFALKPFFSHYSPDPAQQFSVLFLFGDNYIESDSQLVPTLSFSRVEPYCASFLVELE